MKEIQVSIYLQYPFVGKTTVASDTIQKFLEEASNNRAVYVGLSNKNSTKIYNSLSTQLQNQFLAVTISSDNTKISDAEHYLAPK